MKKLKNIMTLLVVALSGLSLTACSEDDLDTNQYVGGVSLNVYGPQPVMRGGQLRFLGSNLDQISQVVIPGVEPITAIEVIQAGVPSEIRITVPHDGPEVGAVKLIAKDGTEITTKTELTYIEGIEVTNMTASAMPGDIITIEGDYLNLIHMVEFSEKVQVGENDFTEHTRYVIKLAVPETAKTGKLNLYTADLTVSEVAENNVEYQIIETEKALEVGTPTVSKLASPRGEAAAQGTITVKQGETVTVTGSYYKLIETVKVGDVEIKDFTVSEDGNTLSFVLPAEAPDEAINLVCLSGVEVPVGSIVTVKPTNCNATPAPVKAGQILTINGEDMDVVIGVEFPDAKGEYTISIYESSIHTVQIFAITVPETATDGNLKLVMANGSRIEVPFTLLMPTVTGYDNATVSAGAKLVIQGTDLDLIKTVTFGEGSDVVEVEGTTDAITLDVPMNAKTGKPTLTLANGKSIEGPELTVNEAVFCYVTEMPEFNDETTPKAGGTFTVPVANGDKLTGVEINGTACQFILSGDQLTIGIPGNARKNSQLRLISSNGEITYNLTVIPATEVTEVIWQGLTQITWSDGGRVLIPASKFEGVPAGAVMTISYAQKDQTWAQAQFNYGDWSGINFTEGDVKFNQTLVPTDVYGWFSDGILDRNTEVILTQEILDNIQAKKGECEGVADCGIIIQGSDLTFSKITLSYKASLEQTLWEGNEDTNGWSNNVTIGTDMSPELAALNPSVGSVVRFYGEVTDPEWQIKVVEGHWGPTYGAFAAYAHDEFLAWDFDGNGGCVAITLTQEMLNTAYEQKWWGGTFIIQGQFFILKKVTVE